MGKLTGVVKSLAPKLAALLVDINCKALAERMTGLGIFILGKAVFECVKFMN
ncbi:hypothetical protein KUL118_65050 [Tenacibaculum sp. KUL118]|nr:hypothetical protein KUL118_65050 [Tenacibaculum sp. KUL118]